MTFNENSNLGEKDPVATLRELEVRAGEISSPLPVVKEFSEFIKGVLIKVEDYDVIIPMEEVSEIIIFEDISSIPKTKRWMLGLSNVRGNLIPVMDFMSYIKNTAVKLIRHTARIAVVKHNNLTVGIVVNGVSGMKKINREDISTLSEDIPSTIKPYSIGECVINNQRYFMMSLKRILEDQAFLAPAK